MGNIVYDILPFIVAKRKLKDNGITSTPNNLLLGLVPGLKMSLVPQVIMNNSVVDKEIADKNKVEAVATASGLQAKIDDITANVKALPDTPDADTVKAFIKKVRVSVGLDSSVETGGGGGVVTPTP